MIAATYGDGHCIDVSSRSSSSIAHPAGGPCSPMPRNSERLYLQPISSSSLFAIRHAFHCQCPPLTSAGMLAWCNVPNRLTALPSKPYYVSCRVPNSPACTRGEDRRMVLLTRTPTSVNQVEVARREVLIIISYPSLSSVPSFTELTTAGSTAVPSQTH